MTLLEVRFCPIFPLPSAAAPLTHALPLTVQFCVKLRLPSTEMLPLMTELFLSQSKLPSLTTSPGPVLSVRSMLELASTTPPLYRYIATPLGLGPGVSHCTTASTLLESPLEYPATPSAAADPVDVIRTSVVVVVGQPFCHPEPSLCWTVAVYPGSVDE